MNCTNTFNYIDFYATSSLQNKVLLSNVYMKIGRVQPLL